MYLIWFFYLRQEHGTKISKDHNTFAVVGIACTVTHLTPLLGKIGKASACHTQRRKTEMKEMKLKRLLMTWEWELAQLQHLQISLWSIICL
jgi:hypothetical protein